MSPDVAMPARFETLDSNSFVPLPVKAAVYLTLTNAAVLAAWGKYIAGVRQELWTPSQRAHSRRP